jgi:glycosyltransferase involved in cell wall biosynthesis
LRAAGGDVTMLSPPDGDGDLRVPFFGGRPFFRAARLGRGFDRVVVHFQPALYAPPRRAVSKVLSSAGLLWLAARRPNVEILVHEADEPIRWRPDYVLLRWAFRRAPKLLVHTEAERDELERDYGVAPGRIEILPHRVEPAAGPVSRDEARASLGLTSAEPPVFVCPGFLQGSKGFDRALRAFARAGGGSLFVVGSVREETPQNRAHLTELRRLANATPAATLVERYVDDAEFDLWIDAADRVVLPYRRSWSSGVLARAHALGRPSIVTAEGGLADQAGPEDVLVRDDEELADALREEVAAVTGAKR